jgi:acetyltransferase-like isoleucine patch superfamily enzyme
MDGPDETAGVGARTREYLQRRSRQGLRIVRQALGLDAAKHAEAAHQAAEGASRAAEAAGRYLTAIRDAALAQRAAADERAAAAAARLAAVPSDEDDERAALAAAASRLQACADTIATLSGAVTLCGLDGLRPLRRADIDVAAVDDIPDLRGVMVGEGVALPRGIAIESSGEQNFVVIAPRARLRRVQFVVRGTGNLIYIGPGARLHNLVVKTVGDGNTIAIGRDVTVESGSFLCERSAQAVLVGDDCMVSNGVVVRTSDHHGIFDRRSGERLNPPADVVVGPHVWLGNGCRVNKGSRIGAGSVIGQGAIASGTMDENSIYAGVPARKLRGDIVWSRSESLEDVGEPFR